MKIFIFHLLLLLIFCACGLAEKLVRCYEMCDEKFKADMSKYTNERTAQHIRKECETLCEEIAGVEASSHIKVKPTKNKEDTHKIPKIPKTNWLKHRWKSVYI